AYFRSLLTFLWQALDPGQRRHIGPWVPLLIWAFLEPDFAALGTALGAVGLTQAQVEQVLEETYPQASIRRAIGAAARSTVRYFRDVGALDDGATHDAFATAGLLEAPE
ncbi:MAG TPA: hypothetical protein VHH34_22865, partial [Pseudonocardiaceae bacterium]|nr:hypothetical protein [Pseudonocardiaceae bacterium]